MLENIIVYLFTLFVRGSVDEQSRSPFRRWYSRMLEFRTLLAPNVQFGLFTATLTRAAKHKVFSMLDIDETQILCIENTPLKQNIRYSVQYINNILLRSHSRRLLRDSFYSVKVCKNLFCNLLI